MFRCLFTLVCLVGYCYSQFSVTINPSSFPIETRATVNWTAPSGHDNDDYVNWYYIDTDGTETFLEKTYVYSYLRSGSVTFSGTTDIPYTGAYIARFFVASDNSLAATSNIGSAV